jgi:tetratricopeptide (TPR) repeat protein
MAPTPHDSLQHWRLERLIGRANEQRWLEQLLRHDIPDRRGRTVVITSPIGSGKVALARFALWDSLYSLSRSIEINAITGEIPQPPETDDKRIALKVGIEVLKDIGEHLLPLPLSTLFVALVSLWSNTSLEERRQRLINMSPTPQSLRKLVRDVAAIEPFVLHITGLDDPNLDEQWIEAIDTLANDIHDNRPVLLLLSTNLSQRLSDPEVQEWQLTPVQRHLRKLLGKQIIQARHLGSVSFDDIAHYVRNYLHETVNNKAYLRGAVDEPVIRRLYELSGGWPLMVQELWKHWLSTAQKDSGGGSRKPVLGGDGFTVPWHFTPYGITASADVEILFREFVYNNPERKQAYSNAKEILANLLDDDEEPEETLHYILSVATLEGTSFTGMAVAKACELQWEDGLEEVFDTLVDAGLLIDDPEGYDEVPTPDGPQLLYRYRFTLPIWWHFFHGHRDFSYEDRRDAAHGLAQALEECYGPLAWRRVAAITKLWELAGEPERARFERHFLDQLAYIDRLEVRARLAEQYAQQTGTWIDAHEAWLKLAREMRGYVSNEVTFAAFEQARLAAEQADAPLRVARTWELIAYWASEIENDIQAKNAAHQGLVMLESESDPEAQRIRALLLHHLGRVHHIHNELDLALEHYEQARKLQESYDFPADLSLTLHNIAKVYLNRNEHDQALENFIQARKLDEVHSSSVSLATTLHWIGRVHHARNDLDQALQYYEQARKLQEIHAPPLSLAGNFMGIAMAHYDLRNSDQALQYFEQARRFWEIGGSLDDLATSLRWLGHIHYNRKDLDQALQYYEQARKLHEFHGPPNSLAAALHMIGRIHHDRENLDQALQYYQQAHRLAEAHSLPGYLAVTLHNIGHVYHNCNELDLALKYLQHALEIMEQESDQEALSATLHYLAVVCLDRGECQDALNYVRRALDIRRAVQDADVAEEESLERRILDECPPQEP